MRPTLVLLLAAPAPVASWVATGHLQILRARDGRTTRPYRQSACARASLHPLKRIDAALTSPPSLRPAPKLWYLPNVSAKKFVRAVRVAFMTIVASLLLGIHSPAV